MATLHVIAGADTRPAYPVVHRISVADIKTSLRQGIGDFFAMPSHAIFLCLIYPIVGLALARMAFGYAVLPLLFPLASGFALLGPVAAVGLYELSRRRENGQGTQWTHVFDVLRSPSFPAIAALGVLLMVVFLTWLAVAQAIYQSLFGTLPPDSITQFSHDVFNTPEGLRLMVIGNGVGFLFAVGVFVISAISFPLLLDRDVGAAVAIMTSVRAVIANPVSMGLWAIIVAVALILGSLPFFFGLAIVMPVLGHATWHLYRKVVS